MASIGISASIQRACSSQHITKKVWAQARTARSSGTTDVVTPNVEALKLPEKQQEPPLVTTTSNSSDEHSHPRFCDARWKNGTWDLNMFVKQGRMDWDSVIVAGNLLSSQFTLQRLAAS